MSISIGSIIIDNNIKYIVTEIVDGKITGMQLLEAYLSQNTITKNGD